MKILLFHPVLLPPRNYGGVERVVLWLAKGLVERGHEVYIGASPGSQLPPGCQLIPIESRDHTLEEWKHFLPGNLDVIHCMAPLSSSLWAELPVPAVLTVHGNGKPGEIFPKNTVFLSQDHAKRHGAQVYVYNGIDPAEFLFQPMAERDGFLFLSKTSWRVKNVRGAIDLCQKAGRKLKIAGGNRPWFERARSWFDPTLEWVGSVSGEKKAELLSQAQALVFPVLWSEPFGLVVVESLMSGTPVLGSPRGSLPELIPPQVGALPKNELEWIQILSQTQLPWSPMDCRQWAMEKFHYAQMAQNYETVYQQVISGRFLHPNEPQTCSVITA